MTTHSCSYYCERPECIKRQRDELRDSQGAKPAKPPKHNYWGVGEVDCPRDIKAGNGELHSLRCKVCGETNPPDEFCWNAAPPPQASPQAPSQEPVAYRYIIEDGGGPSFDRWEYEDLICGGKVPKDIGEHQLLYAAPQPQGATLDDVRDAARWRWIEQHFRVLSLHIDGNHHYCATVRIGRITGPTFGAAVDAAIQREREKP
jgi:hypothetical protein